MQHLYFTGSCLPNYVGFMETARLNDYEPIACSFHDVLEIAIMHRSRLTACWRGPDGSRQEGTLRPLDLQVRDGAEWLIARDERGTDIEVRLDRLESARPLD